MPSPKITIGVPTPGTLDYRFCEDLKTLIYQNWREFQFQESFIIGSRIVMNRNEIVRQARLFGADYILWIDSDTRFPHTALKRLIAHDKEIVCATTSRRVGENRAPAAYPLDVKGIQPFQQLVPMRFIGFPFMLTRMSVFDKIKRPYFAEPPRRLVGVYEAKEYLPAEEMLYEVMPEDEYFCWQVRQAGMEILCDMELSMEIGHIGSTVYYISNPLPSGDTKGDILFEPVISDEAMHRAQDGIGE